MELRPCVTAQQRRALEAELCEVQAAVAQKKSRKARKKAAAAAAAAADAHAAQAGADATQASAAEADDASGVAADEPAVEPSEPSEVGDAAETSPPKSGPAVMDAAGGEGEGEGGGEGRGEEGVEAEVDEDEAALNAETFGMPAAGGAGADDGGVGWLPPTDLVAAGGRVEVQELDMESLARQSANFGVNFAESADSAASDAAGRHVQQLVLRLAAEQQSVRREQHITARMWLEKSQAEEAAEDARARLADARSQLAAWEAWEAAQRRRQRARRQAAIGSPAQLLELVLDALGARSANALSSERRARLAASLAAASELLSATDGVPAARPPGL